MTKTTVDPKQHDEALAALYHDLARAEQQIAYNNSSLLGLAKAEYYYRGRKRVTDMTLEEAETIVAEALRDMQRHEGNHYGDGRWVGYVGRIAPYDKDRAHQTLDKRSDLFAAAQEIFFAIHKAEESYTGWSRFFLVTSSQGHIHSSMNCHTCRPTTTYGWLPELSGKSEAEAVEAHGPALCSECFASAPVEWVGGKISKAQAERKAA